MTLLAGAVVATFINLVWQTLDYGFPDDLPKPAEDKAKQSSHLASKKSDQLLLLLSLFLSPTIGL